MARSANVVIVRLGLTPRMEDSCVSEEPHVEKATQPELGTPEPTMDGPVGALQIIECPAPAHFHDTYFVALLWKPMGGNTAAKSRSDDDKVEIELAVGACHISRSVVETEVPQSCTWECNRENMRDL